MARQPLSLPFSGKRLLAWRERAGLTQQELAVRCGLSRFQISRWETERNKPEPAALGRLVRGLVDALGRSDGGDEAFGVDDLLDIPWPASSPPESSATEPPAK
jgi:transcriptional regulator with XRE-family HTH domain